MAHGPLVVECVEHVFRRLSQDVTASEFKTLIKKHQIKGQTVRTVYDYLTTKFNQQSSQGQGVDFRKLYMKKKMKRMKGFYCNMKLK